ncbi:hypothetical protein Amet_1058 [Alkaliphilus metalliredigens QYMF]|uniref:Uncharacterized protein n=1 Tax=Alkaliphilus metalliredigens (strain QYMF) TaxID=293826 RepID=A6TM52_ALKMQ|nr:hypothetical protein [Alkaliphilus metalliredigens]ABR47270.1 hypothetical protein Amet_1058 [Alkaliphilus metalliredigens QYMF]
MIKDIFLYIIKNRIIEMRRGNMKKIDIVKKVFQFILIICIVIVWLYMTADLMIGRLGVSGFIGFSAIALFGLINYFYKS